MNLEELLQEDGRGVIATSDAKGVVNTAIYARPHILDEKTIAWGMTDGSTYHNLLENPYASFLYINPGAGLSGIRIRVKLREIVQEGEILTQIRMKAAEIVSRRIAAAIKFVGFFDIIEIKPLI